MFICWEFGRFSGSLMWKCWHAGVDTIPFPVGANRLLSTSAKPLRLFNLLLLLFGQRERCLWMCWFIQKYTAWDPFRLPLSLLPHLSIMSRALTAWGMKVHLGTEWAIKWAPAGVPVVMLRSARRCSTQPRLAWLPREPILLKCFFVMGGIWIYEHLVMTLLWQSQTDGSSREREGWKDRGESQRERAWWRLNQGKWERACGQARQCRRYERQRRLEWGTGKSIFATALNDPSAEVRRGCRDGVCFALGMCLSSSV